MISRTRAGQRRTQQLIRSAIIGFLIGDALLLGLYLTGRPDTVRPAPPPGATSLPAATEKHDHDHKQDGALTVPVMVSDAEAAALTCIQEYLARTPYDPVDPEAFDRVLLAGQNACAGG